MRTLCDFFVENSVRITFTEYSMLGYGHNSAGYLSVFQNYEHLFKPMF